jgi:hypothetical protein
MIRREERLSQETLDNKVIDLPISNNPPIPYNNNNF